jgi:diguanylate cyclase (GGDEF)-like protein
VAPVRILVVDDEPSILAYLKLVLEPEGYGVTTAVTLFEAREAVAAGRLDLILCDKNLPDGSGLELAEELSRAPAGCELLMMTGYASLGSAVEAMRYGVADYLQKPLDRDEILARLARALKTLRLKQENGELLAELRRQNAVLEKLAVIDPLTQLFNHAYFQESLDRELQRAGRFGVAFSVVMIDVDGFKALNNQYGHRVGNDVLKRFSEALRGRGGRMLDLAFRLREQDIAARYGGDEFAVILPHTEKAGAAVLAERLRKMFEGAALDDSQQAQVTLSLGVAAYPEDATDRDGIIEAADMALYAAKTAGRNRVVSYTPALGRGSNRRLTASAEGLEQVEALLRSMEERTFKFAYQPIVDVEKWVPFGYEALARPMHARLPNPKVLFDTAESSGQIRALGRVLRDLCVAPLGELDESCALFVNLHPHELHDPRLLDSDNPMCKQARRVILEITESAELGDVGRTREVIGRLRAQGFRIAVDDLGAGYSGLNSLSLLEPDYVKLDIEMVRALRASDRMRRLVEHILDFAHGEGMKVVAEGIESQEEMTVVRSLGVTLMQGYYFARPAPPFVTLPPKR